MPWSKLLPERSSEPSCLAARKAVGSFGVVLAILAFVLISVTISMVCAVFEPVWQEFRQAARDREAAQANAAAAVDPAEARA